MFENSDFKPSSAQLKALDVIRSRAMYVALGGGSRSGKTFLIVLVILLRALKAPGSRHVIFRYRFNAVKRSIIMETLPKVCELCFPETDKSAALWPNIIIDRQEWFATLPNGSEIWFGGLEDKERVDKILGKEYATLYFNESSEIPWNSVEVAFSRLAQNTSLALKAFFDFNPPAKTHWTYQYFVEKRNPLNKRPVNDPGDIGFFLINPADNKENLPEQYFKVLENLTEKQRNRFLYGKFADDGDGIMWSVELLEQNRREQDIPDFIRIIIAVDPSGCSGPEDTRSDEVGIVVAALGIDGHGYLLEDLSGRWSPEQWSEIVNSAYSRHQADRVVAEKNYGGDMVRAVLQAKNPNLPFTDVTASRGKVVRAEPISNLYHQNKIHHVGSFPDVEDQLCSMTTGGYVGLKSPDRADALVWAFTHLFPMMTKKSEDNWKTPQTITRSRSSGRLSNR